MQTPTTSGGKKVFALVALLTIALTATANADTAEAERNYQRFLNIYRQEAPTTGELENAASFLETANLLAPGNYKYVYSLGAVNSALGNWQKATEWLRKASALAQTESQRQRVEDELNYCSYQLAKVMTADRGGAGMEITFIMKEGTVELSQDAIRQMPSRLPTVGVNENPRALVRAIENHLERKRKGRVFILDTQ